MLSSGTLLDLGAGTARMESFDVVGASLYVQRSISILIRTSSAQHLELAAATQAWDAENVSIDSMPANQGRAIFCSCPRLLSTLAKLTDRLKLVHH